MDVRFIDKLVSPVLMDMLNELITNKQIDSSMAFIYKYHRSYVQVSKYKKWLNEKGFIEVDRTGKNETMRLTVIGKKIVAQFKKLIEISNQLEGGAKK